MVLAVGHLVAEHYHVHFDTKDRPLLGLLRTQQKPACRYSE
jgi:hypothetical protein